MMKGLYFIVFSTAIYVDILQTFLSPSIQTAIFFSVGALRMHYPLSWTDFVVLSLAQL